MFRVDEMESRRPIIMQHYIESHANNGGPATGLKLLMNSKLSKKYYFFPLVQRKEITNSLSLLFDLKKQIKNVNPSIVHVRGLQSPGFICLLAARLAGCKKVIVSVHGSSIDSLAIGRIKHYLYRSIIEPFTLRNADIVYCVCNYAANRSYIRKNAKNLYGFIHNVAPDYSDQDFELNRAKIRNELKISADEIVVTYVGRIVQDKGLGDLSKAIKIVGDKQSQRIKYIVVGDGGYLPNLKDALNEEAKKKQVLFLGMRSDVRDILLASDIFVFPTLHENLSNSLLEACAAGLAVIATNVGGNPEVIEHNVTGFLVSPKNPDAIAQSIRTLASNPEIRKNLGRNAKENVQNNFSQNFIFEQMDSVYDSLLMRDN